MKLRYLVAAAALVLAASGCGDSGAPAAASSPTPTPSPGFDKATVRACAYAKKAGEGVDAAAFKAAHDAVAAASTSDVAALREIANMYAPDGSRMDNVNAQTGVLKISTWCLDHGMG
jgi:hypothetical protein